MSQAVTASVSKQVSQAESSRRTIVLGIENYTRFCMTDGLHARTCLSATQNLILGFHVTSRHHKIVLNSKCHFFWLQKWIKLGHVSQVTNVWISRHGMSSNMAAPYETLFVILEILWITATLPKWWLESEKLATWLTWPSSIHFWSQKKWYLLFKRILWSLSDLLVKTINSNGLRPVTLRTRTHTKFACAFWLGASCFLLLKLQTKMLHLTL